MIFSPRPSYIKTPSCIKAIITVGLTTIALSSFALESLKLETASIAQYFDLEATLEAVNESTVSAQTSGAVEGIFFDVNDQVEAGSLLIKINDTQQQASLQQALANLEQAKAQNEDAQVLLKRNKRLFDQQTLSQGEYDSTVARAKSAAAGVKAAEAGLKQAREQLAYTQVKAPFSGIVKARHMEMGELVSPGQPLMTGLALTPLRAVTDLPQRIAQEYKSAEQVSVLIGSDSIAPESTTLFPYADARHHSVRLRALLPQTETALYPGQWAKLRIQTGERDAILVPSTSILQRGELAGVYVLIDGQPRLRQVRAGELFNGQTEILSGLKAGDQIIVDALAQLADLSSKQ